MKRIKTFRWWHVALLIVFIAITLVGYLPVTTRPALAAADTYKATSQTTIQATGPDFTCANGTTSTDTVTLTLSGNDFVGNCTSQGIRGPGVTRTWTISGVTPNGNNYTATITATGGPATPNGTITINGNGITLQTTSTTGGAGSQAPTLVCTLSPNPLTWFICPLIAGAQGAVEELTNGIDSLLTINTSTIFANNTKAGTTSAGFYQAWNAFRIIAVGLIVIAGLIMLIAQAIGSDFIDAYTVRKVLPRLLLATIFISLSWWILDFLVQLSNDVGTGIRAIIYAPFNTIGNGGVVRINGGAATVGALVGGGALLGLGLIGAGSFLLTALLAVFVGFIVLILRQVVIMMLIVFAPLAIACYILPGTERAWRFWRDTLLSMLIVFPIISAFIAMGRVAAVVMYNSSVFIPTHLLQLHIPFRTSGRIFGLPLSFATIDDINFAAAINNVPSAIKQLSAFILFFLPYFLIPLAFRVAGGAMAQIGGFVNDRHRGAFDRLKNFRKGRAAENFSNIKTGDRFKGNNFLADRFNRTTRGLSAASKVGVSGFNPIGASSRRKRAAAYDTLARVSGANRAKSDEMQQLQFDDDGIAALFLSSGRSSRRARDELTRLHRHQNAAGQMDWDDGWGAERVDRAVAAADAAGINQSNAIAASQLMAMNKSRSVGSGQEAIDAVQTTHDLMAGVRRDAGGNIVSGNRQLEENLRGAFQFHSRRSGRTDLAGNNLAQAWTRSSMQELAQDTRPALTAHLNSIVGQAPNAANPQGVGLNSTDVATRGQAAIQLVEAHNLLTHGVSADNQAAINEALNGIGFTQPVRDSGQTIEDFLATNYMGGTAAAAGLRSQARVWDAGGAGGGAQEYQAQVTAGTGRAGS
jgi:hypothetical protein